MRVLCAAFVLLAIIRPAVGEVFVLRSGGRIEGELVNPDENPRTSYVISLPSGGQITLDAKVVEKVQPVRPSWPSTKRSGGNIPTPSRANCKCPTGAATITSLRSGTRTWSASCTRSRPDRRPPAAGLSQVQRQVDDA